MTRVYLDYSKLWRIIIDKACFDAAIEALKNCARKSRTDPEKYAKATETMLRKMEKDVDQSNEAVVIIQALIVWKNVEAAEKAYHRLQPMMLVKSQCDQVEIVTWVLYMPMVIVDPRTNILRPMKYSSV